MEKLENKVEQGFAQVLAKFEDLEKKYVTRREFSAVSAVFGIVVTLIGVVVTIVKFSK